MMRLRMVLICLCCLLWNASSYADSLIITYHSGKIQTIPLDDSIQTINTLQYLSAGSQTPNSQPVVKLQQEPQNIDAVEKPEAQPATTTPPTAQKTGVKFKWADPVEHE